MDWVPLVVICGLALATGAIAFQYLRNLRRKEITSSDITVHLRPTEHIASFDGWASLEMRLDNRSGFKAWMEDAELVTTDLDANFQTAVAIGKMSHQIRQTVHPNETLAMSITGSLYEAAGKPQGPYSFLLTGTVRYRIEEDWAQSNMPSYRIEMTALSVLRLRRIRTKDAAAEYHDRHTIIDSSTTQVRVSKETAKAKAAHQ
jgi:hypothetical protein